MPLRTTSLAGIVGVHGSKVQGFKETGFGMRIYGKSVSFVSSNPKFGARLAITWEKEPF